MGFKTYRTIQTSLSVYLKNTLVAHQILYLLLMAILVGLACWLLIWTVQFNEFETIMKTYYFSSGKLILLLSSIVGAGVAVFGYCIFNVSSPILLLTHIICNFILISAFLSVSVCGFLLLLQLDFDFANKFTLAITKYYGINLSLRRNVGLTTAVDEIQSKFECCGTFGEKSNSKSVVQYVPDSCCVLKDRNLRFNNFLELQMKNDVFLDRETCIGYKSLATRDDTAPRIDNPAYITRSNTYLYEKGCVSVVKQEYQKYALMLAASGTTALVLSIVGFIISSVLLFHIEYQQFIRLSTEWSASVSTANIQSSVQDNINIIPKHLTEDEILAKA
ncbi:hypothetical protein KSF78_0004818 [Schistosoma japonicum]|nr:hypothetical protein KSF78_0004818 [Schistosoma japonicum]